MEAVVVELTKSSLSTPSVAPVSRVVSTKEVTEPTKVSETQQDTPIVDVNVVNFSELVSKVTEVVQGLGTKVSFSYDDRTPEPIIRVVDDESGELIRQIPREEMLHLMSRLREISGLIFERSI